MKKDSTAYKAILLAILCALCGLVLSGINELTAPTIAKNRLATELASLEQIYPGADFEQIEFDDPSGLIQGVYKAPGKGMVYKIRNVGYNSNGFTFMVAFNEDGTIGGFLPIEQNETDGFGARCFEPEYTATINSLTSSDPVPLLSGATLTSGAIQQGIDAAKALFNSSAGISYDPSAQATPAPAPALKFSLKNEDFSKLEPEAEEISNDGKKAVFRTKSGGFSFLNEKGEKNEAEVTVNLDDGSVDSFRITKFADTAGIGDAAVTDEALAKFKGLKAGDDIDGVSGATFTSRSLAGMLKSVFDKLGGGSSAAAPVSKYAECEPEVEEISNDGTTAKFRVKSGGFGFQNENGDKNEAEIEIDLPSGTVKSFTLTKFADTEGIGDTATTDEQLAKFVGVSDPEEVDTVSGATFTGNSLKGMLQSVLDKLKSSKPEDTAAAPAEAEVHSGPDQTAPVSKYAECEPEVEEISNDGTTAKFRVKSGGFGFQNENGDKNEAEVEIDLPSGTVKSFTLTKFADTEGIGDTATTDEQLAKFVGVSDPEEVDTVSGATFTGNSLKGMLQSVLDKLKSSKPEETAAAPAKEEKGSDAAPLKYAECEPEVEELSNDGKTAKFRVRSGGFSFLNGGGDKNEAEIEVDVPSRTIRSFKITKFSDTDGIGDAATAEDILSRFTGVSDPDEVDTVSGATFTSKSVKSMVESVLSKVKSETSPAALPATETGK